MRTAAPLQRPVHDEARLILKDGSVAGVRAATPADAGEMRQFFHLLSPKSRYHRFFSAGEPSEEKIARLCDDTQPERSITLVATRLLDGASHFVGVGSYFAVEPDVAEVAFAINDDFQGKGIVTALLERLGIEAVRHGFHAFRGATLSDNAAMLDVFRNCGFHERPAGDAGTIEFEMPLTPTPEDLTAINERVRGATAASIRPLLRPRAVAVIGASHKGGGIGRRILDCLSAAGFRGPLYPVNRKGGEIGGKPAVRSVQQAPGPIDLAVIAVPRDAVLAAVDDCAAAGVKAIVVITAGFAETDAAGRALQDQLVQRVRGYGMRMVGPNCMGVINADALAPLNASFSPVFPPPGSLALSSQSGALGAVILSLASRRQVGISSFVSVGNKADVSTNDLLEYWAADTATSVIALYVESFGNPRRFARLAREIGRDKPIIAVKAGRTRAGSRAAGSHTAALAANDVVVDALFQQTGVIRADTIDEMFDLAACLSVQPLPAGRRVAIVTNAGGPGILAADACDAAGLTVVEISDATRARIGAALPSLSVVGNPLDMIASAGPDEYRGAIEAVLGADDVDALVLLYTPVDPAGSAAIVGAIRDGVAAARAAGATEKPILACLMAEGDQGPLIVGDERIPVYAFPENAVRALGKISTYAAWCAAPAGTQWTFDDVRADDARAICRAVSRVRGEAWLTSEETRRVLNAFGIVPDAGVITKSAEEAAGTAEAMGFPVVAKLISAAVVHKSDIGGVKLNLGDRDAVIAAFAALEGAARDRGVACDGVLIQPMTGGGVETMIGIIHDRLFGPIIGFGLGGTEVEILGDMHFRAAPLTDRDIDDLIDSTRAARLLSGYRGRPAGDRAALVELLSRVSCLADEVPDILELDLNPVIVLPAGRGCRVVDVRIKVGRPTA